MPTKEAIAPADVEVRSVLIADDFSPASEKALRHGVAIAQQYRAKLYLTHVVSSVGLDIAGPDAIAQATTLASRDLREKERELLVSGVLKDMDHDVIIRQGNVWTELKAVIKEENIDLIVLGTHARTGLKRLVLGSVAEQIFRQACCRVLTVGPCSPPDAVLATNGTPRPVLFATDFSEASLKALPQAADLANQRRATLVLLHVVSLVDRLRGNSWYGPSDLDRMKTEAELASRKRLEESAVNLQGILPPTYITAFGEPAEEILQAARKLSPEVLVMGLGCRHYVDTISHFPWSTAYEVVSNAACPVLTVRTTMHG